MADLQEAMTACCETMLTFLEESAVPEDQLAPLRELCASTATEDAEELLNIAEEIGNCVAYMRHDRLVKLLKEAWKATCDYKQHQRKMAFRKVRTLEADTKTDPEILEKAKTTRDELDHACGLANVKYYTMQALEKVLDEDPLGSVEDYADEVMKQNAAKAEAEQRAAAEAKEAEGGEDKKGAEGGAE